MFVKALRSQRNGSVASMTTGNGTPLGAREAMIIAAERRFAISGLEGASLRQIAIEANQRNESAAQYHFGSREALIKAILQHRVPKVDARREKWLQNTHLMEELGIARFIASAAIYPIADEIFDRWRSCYWVRFISQLVLIGKYSYLYEESEAPAFVRTFQLLESIPGVDSTILAVRREIFRGDVVWGLARIEALSFDRTRETCELHVANLVDMLSAGISVPPSRQTQSKATAVTMPHQ